MSCKVCGSKGPMKKNTKGNDSDTCTECHKKYKRMQHLRYTIGLAKITDLQVVEYNKLVKDLIAKTKQPIIKTGTQGLYFAEVEDRVNAAAAKAMQEVISQDNVFALYAAACPRKVLMNQDKRFGGASRQQEREECKDEYEGTIQYLYDTINAVASGTSVASFDRDLWEGNLQNFALFNSEVLSMESIDSDGTCTGVEPEYMYHWLSFVYATWSDVAATELISSTEAYLCYSVDEAGQVIVK